MTAAVSPEDFARIVRGSSREQLAAGLRANGAAIVAQVLEEMGRQLLATRFRGVLEWHLTAPEPGTWQVAVDPGGAAVHAGAPRRPQVRYTIDGVDFLQLAAGVFQGPELVISRRLRIRGNPITALRVALLLRSRVT